MAGVDVKFAQIVESKPGRSAGFGFAAFHTSNDMGMAVDRFGVFYFCAISQILDRILIAHIVTKNSLD